MLATGWEEGKRTVVEAPLLPARARVRGESLPDAGENDEFGGRRCADGVAAATAADDGGGAGVCLFGYMGGFSGEKNEAGLL